MRNFIFLLFVLVGLTVHAQDPLIISGTVTDDSGKAVEGATVFISNSRIVMTTNAAGHFATGTMQPGTYELVVRMLGFTSAVRPVVLQQKAANLNIALKEDATLKEVVIKTKSAPDPNRPKYLELFKQYFIGRLSNAGRCVIKNPDALIFYKDPKTGVLEAHTNEFLVVENSALGYKMNYLLRNFKLDLVKYSLYYEGSPYFEDMQGTDTQQKRWESNRQVTYEGSAMHFIRTLFTNTSQAEGFLVYKKLDDKVLKSLTKIDLGMIEPFDAPSLFAGVDNDFKVFRGAEPILVVYTKEDEPNWYQISPNHINMPFKIPAKIKAVSKKVMQVSQITPLITQIQVDRNGGFPPTGFLFNGYWSLERIADQMPLDYVSIVPTPGADAAAPLIPEGAKTMIAALDSFKKKVPVEKVHIHVDKSYYAVGDTIWMKGYVVNGINNKLSDISKILNVDVIDESDSVKATLRLPITEGLAAGDIVLGSQFREGNYRIRAYTNWMRNFGEDYFFDKVIPVGDVLGSNVITNVKYTSSKAGDKDNITADISYTALDGTPLAGREVNYSVAFDAANSVKGKGVTDDKGSLNVNFAGNAAAAKPAIITTNLDAGNKKVIIKTLPVKIASSVDVQFFPEGGKLVNNINSAVAFKAVGTDGLGVNVSGYVADKDNNKIVDFKAAHAGMGVFRLTPSEGNSYTAVVKFPDGSEKKMELPKALVQGYVLSIDNSGKDTVRVRISVSPTILQTGSEITLIAKTNNEESYVANTKLKSVALTARIPRSRFAAGVTQFTLFDSFQQPVAERLAFMQDQDPLNITFSAAKTSYSAREKVNMNMEVEDLREKSSFSVAVTNTSAAPADEESETTIFSNLLLSSELKGYIEKPNYYFTNFNEAKAAELDNLMLTQGWRMFDTKYPMAWKAILSDKQPALAYKPEKGISISGKILSGNNAAAGGKVIMIGPGITRDTVTDAAGRFNFDNLDFDGTRKITLQARDEKGKADVKIVMDSIPGQVVSLNKSSGDVRISVNSSMITYLKNNAEQIAQLQQSGMMRQTDIQLKEVQINTQQQQKAGYAGKEVIENSSNMNLAGHYNYVVKAEQLKGAVYLADGLMGKVPGIRVESGAVYQVSSRGVGGFGKGTALPMLLVLDGVTLNNPATDPPPDPANPERSVFNSINVFDIETVEVLTGGNAVVYGGSNSAAGVLVITTKKGGSSSASKLPAPGILNTKGVGYQFAREFYSPVYTGPKTPQQFPDLRTTVYWNAEIIPDNTGKAAFEFYTADKPGTYRAVIEGLDYAGKLGRQVFTYTVK